MGRKPPTLLTWSLGINLALSLSCGLTAALFGPVVADGVGAFPLWLVVAIGIGLLVFAAGIGWTLMRLRLGQALLISGLDLLWVLVTVPLTVVPGLLTADGVALVLLLAALVGALGVFQLAGIRAMLSADAPLGPYRHCIRLRSVADPGKLWQVIRDLGSISRYSAGLSASRLEGKGKVAPGAVRVCTNKLNQSWAEEVVSLDDAARSIVFRFRSEADDFPFPLAALSGGWTVTPDTSGGAYVDVWWSVTPRQRRFGWLVVALMTVALDRDLPRIVGAMQAAAMGQQPPATGPKPALGFGYC